jgi:hypothetical protein
MGIEVVDEGASACLSNLVVESELLAWIKVAQLERPECTNIRQLLMHKGFTLRMLGCSPMSTCRMVKD